MTAPGNLKEVLWDLDGTILDSRKQHFTSSERRIGEIYRSIISEEAAFLPGVVNWLKRFQTMGLIQDIASSTAKKNIETILKALDAGHFFDQIFSSAEVPSKPDPAIFNLASEKLEVHTQYFLVIEDSSFGVSAAKSAGMKCLAVTNTNSAEYL